MGVHGNLHDEMIRDRGFVALTEKLQMDSELTLTNMERYYCRNRRSLVRVIIIESTMVYLA